MASPDPESAEARASAWKERHVNLETRAFAARQRELAARGREDAARVRESAARIRAEAAAVREEGARTRDDAARVRDRAAAVRDDAARARDLATQAREEATRQRFSGTSGPGHAGWQELQELDRRASLQGRQAATSDREAAQLDRAAAEKDREAADRDRAAANKDRDAADQDRDAAEKDRRASDADRIAADCDRLGSELDLEQAEGRLSRADRLAAMGKLAAGLAHEINNPLAALISGLATIRSIFEGGAGAAEPWGPVVDDVQEAAQRIARAVSGMKGWVRSEQPTQERSPLDLARLVEDAVDVTADSVGRVAMVSTRVDPAVSGKAAPEVWGIEARLRQVLVNLLLNAAEAIAGPKEKNEVAVSVYRFENQLRIEVRDTGSGIAPETLPHIFDPFFSTKTGSGGQGQGLGLAMCEQIIADHGGTLTVETQVGHGSTFRVELPIGNSPLPVPQAARLP